MEPDKLRAVYDLREAAEQHGRREQELRGRSDYASRRRLLESRLDLEDKTKDALEVCHHCGRPHPDDEPHFPGEGKDGA